MAIIIDEKINLLEKVKEVIKGGHILAVYRECDRILAENLLVDIVREYKITNKIYPSNVDNDMDTINDIMDTDEDVRMVLCFGGYNIIENSKVASTMLGIPLFIVLTTPIKVKNNISHIFVDGVLESRKSAPARTILGYTVMLAQRGGFDSLIGAIGESIVASIDNLFQEVIGGKGLFCQSKVDKILDIAINIDENDKVNMLRKCYSIDDMSTIITDISNVVSYNNAKHMESESVKFVISYIILLLYDSYIRYEGDDLLYPPDIVVSAKKISNEYGMDIGKCIGEFKMMSSLDYMRMQHIVGEYRNELINIIDRALATMEHLARVYRRVSRDAGFDMYSNLSLDDLLESISLVSIFEKNNTPLRIMKTGGYLEHYLKTSAL